MNNDNWQRAKQIFNSALDLDTREREKYLSAACEGNADLRAQVDTLLKSYESDFMENGPLLDQGGSNDVRLVAGSKLGRFEILRLINVGGMGEVYLASDRELGRNVAIKILNARYERHEDNLQRFIQEAKSASALNHPNILTIYEIGQKQGSYFIVSEFVEGHTLRTLLRARTMQLPKILDISIQVAEALSAAHRARIIHRDIKPENIIVRDDGYVKVVDFGLAKLLPAHPSLIGLEDETIKQNQTTEGLIMGTVNYMSPEQARGEKIDERTDTFSLGAVIYEMVTGRAPHAADSTTQTMADLLNKEPVPLSQYANVPDDLQRIVSKMLRKRADERYQTMKGLLADLRELKDRTAIDARLDRTSSPETEKATAVLPRTTGDIAQVTTESETRRPWHRRGVVVALVPALLIGILAFSWYWQQPSVQTQPQIKSLAVLPLRSLDSQEDVLGLGIADAVIRRLSQTGALTVRPTSAVRKYLNEDTDALTAAQQLTTDAVLEGSFQRASDRLRVSVNLLRTSDGASLWADSFDMRSADVFTIQDTVAQQVASRLHLKLDSAQQARLTKDATRNPEAYEYFVKGRANAEQRSLAIGDVQFIQVAAENFRKATEVDPSFALAYAELAYAYMWTANFNDPDNSIWIDRMQQALAKAETLDPELAEIHRVRFEYYFSKHGSWDLARAVREARQAIALNPAVGHSELGTMHDHIGLDETIGLRELQRELEIDPTNTYHQGRLVESYRLYGRFDESIEASRRYFGVPSAHALIEKGELDEAEALLQEYLKTNPGHLVNKSWLALAWALKGKQQDAQAVIPELLRQAQNNRAYHHITYNIACIYALAGESEEAVKWLRTTVETGFPNYPMMVRDPHLDRIRKDSKFIQFLDELKSKWEGYKREFS